MLSSERKEVKETATEESKPVVAKTTDYSEAFASVETIFKNNEAAYTSSYAFFWQAMRSLELQDQIKNSFEWCMEKAKQDPKEEVIGDFIRATNVVLLKHMLRSFDLPEQKDIFGATSEYAIKFYQGKIYFSILPDIEKAYSCFLESHAAFKRNHGDELEVQRLDDIKRITVIRQIKSKDHVSNLLHLPNLADLYYHLALCKKKLSITGHEVDTGRAHFLNGLSLGYAGHYKEAIVFFDLAIKCDQTVAEYYYRRGIANWILGNRKLAINDYVVAVKSITDASKQLIYIKSLAEAHYEMGEFQQALTNVELYRKHYEKIYEKPGPLLLTYPSGELGLDFYSLINYEGLFFVHCFAGKVYHQLRERTLSFEHYQMALNLSRGFNDYYWIQIAPELAAQCNEYAFSSLNKADYRAAIKAYELAIEAYKKVVEVSDRKLDSLQNETNKDQKESPAKIDPQAYINLFFTYVSLIQNVMLKGKVNLDKYVKEASVLIKKLRVKQKHFSINISDFIEHAKKMLTEELSVKIDKADFSAEIISLNKKAEFHKNQMKEPAERAVEEFLEFSNRKIAFILPIQVPILEKLRADTILVHHKAFLNYIMTKYRIVKLNKALAKSWEGEGNKGNAFKFYKVALDILNAAYSELEEHQKEITSSSDSPDIQAYKISELKPIFYLLTYAKASLHTTEGKLHLDVRHYSNAKKSLENAGKELEILNKSNSDENDIVSAHEKIFMLAARQWGATVLGVSQMVLDYNQRLDKKLLNDETNKCKRKLEQLTYLDQLTVTYGKKEGDVTAIPFPLENLCMPIKKQRKSADKRETSNLSAHAIGLLYSDGPYDPLIKKPRRFAVLPINVDQEILAAKGASEYKKMSWASFTQSIEQRVKQGSKLCGRFNAESKESKASPLKFFPASESKEFSPATHLHSEQHFYEVLNAIDIVNFIARFKSVNSSFKDGCKVYMVTFDMVSERTSCSLCKISAIQMQNSIHIKGSFLQKLQTYLLENKYFLAGNKSKKENSIGLKTTSRIFAQQLYLNRSNHENPQEKNIKYLSNMGIFEAINVTVFASGSEKSLYQQLSLS